MELAVDFVRMQVARQGWFNRDQMQEAPKPVANQTLGQVIATWPDAAVPVGVRCGDYMFRPHQRWQVTPVPERGGTICGPLYVIKIEGTNRALTATDKLEVVAQELGESDEQLWRIEQLTDGTYRIMPYVIPGKEGKNQKYCLYSAGDSTPTLAEYDFNSDNSKWNFRTH